MKWQQWVVKRRGEREKTSGSSLGLKSHFHADDMQMTAVKCQTANKKVTKYGNLANMCAGVDQGKLILYQQSISTRVVRSDKMSLDLVDSINWGQAWNLPGNLQQCFVARVQE